MYNKILKEEVSSVVFQYSDELQSYIKIKSVNLDEFLEDIDIEVEARERYDYYSLVINNHFKDKQVSTDDFEPYFTAFFKDFYNGVKNAFITELQELKEFYKKDLKENIEDLDYYLNKKYLNDLHLLSEGETVSEEEASEMVSHYKAEIKLLKEKILILNKSFA